MYTITTTNRFEKEVKICKKRDFDMSLLQTVMTLLAENGTLAEKYKSHKLTGNYKDCWECHTQPDGLLV